MKNRNVAFGIFVAVFLLFWNILDYLYATFISRSSYQFAAAGDLIIPLVVAIASGYLLFLRNKKS